MAEERPRPNLRRHGAKASWIWTQRALVILVLGGLLALFLHQMRYPWRWEKIPPYLISYNRETGAIDPGLFLRGLWFTIGISIFGIAGGTVLGLLGGLARLSPREFLSFTATVYVEVIRGTPLIVQVFIMYFGVGRLLGFPPFWAACLAMSIFSGAYIAEVFRAGIQSIDRGQWEAARSLGMSQLQTLRYIVLPQAVRRVLPPLAGEFIALIKDSSLASTISVTELTKRTTDANTHIFAPFELWLTAAGLYFMLTFPLSRLVRILEVRLGKADRRA